MREVERREGVDQLHGSRSGGISVKVRGGRSKGGADSRKREGDAVTLINVPNQSRKPTRNKMRLPKRDLRPESICGGSFFLCLNVFCDVSYLGDKVPIRNRSVCEGRNERIDEKEGGGVC